MAELISPEIVNHAKVAIQEAGISLLSFRFVVERMVLKSLLKDYQLLI